MTPEALVLATANPDKAAELVALLVEALPGVEVRPRPAEVPDVDETGDTLEDNARLKAQALVDATGVAAVADDTGLEVDALGGAPGVRTARFAGEHATYADNVDALLRALDGVPDERRGASFRTVCLVLHPGGQEVLAEGAVRGRITTARRGGGGFGYDPVFVPDEGDGRTFAEMAPAEKHALSHRGRALRALAEALGRDAR